LKLGSYRLPDQLRKSIFKDAVKSVSVRSRHISSLDRLCAAHRIWLFINIFHKQTGDDATPLLAEEIEKVIKELPRDAEVAELFKKIAGGDRLPAR
jgi:hypothetical protein